MRKGTDMTHTHTHTHTHMHTNAHTHRNGSTLERNNTFGSMALTWGKHTHTHRN